MAVDTSMLDLFKIELELHSNALEKGLLDIECNASSAMVEPLMRAAHSIKGAAKIVGLDLAVNLAHAMEDVLSKSMSGERTMTKADVDLLLKGNDFFLALAALDPVAIPDALSEASAAMDQLAKQLRTGEAVAAPQPTPSTEPKKKTETVVSSIDSSMLELFKIELETHSCALETGLLEIERDASPTAVEPLMRAAHSIKGAARIVGLDLAVNLAHAMEDVLSGVLKGERTVSTADVERLLKGNDFFLALANREPAEIPDALAKAADAMDQLAGSLRSIEEQALEPATPTKKSAAPEVPIKYPESGTSDSVVRVQAENLTKLMGLAGEFLVEARRLPELTSASDHSRRETEKLKSILLRASLSQNPSERRLAIDEALRLVEHQSVEQQDLYNNSDNLTRRFEQLSLRLYDQVIASRMRPFEDGLKGFGRVARDIALELGKQARLKIVGGRTPVDRDILEKLEAPLNHLLRNALDHGIERPAERIAAGKKAEGCIELEAIHRAGMLQITVNDDGCGITREALLSSVVSRGQVTGDMAEKMSDEELLEFLFLPGFSTREEVTSLSGRGVGLDIVYSMAREVGGTVKVSTTPGQGMRFRMMLPLTLSVIQTILVEIGGEVFAFPLNRISRLMQIDAQDVSHAEEKAYCTIDDEHVGLVYAWELLELEGGTLPTEQWPIVMLKDHDQFFGLVVERIIGRTELVVHPLDSRLDRVLNIQAAAIGEQGEPILILDTDDLIRSINHMLQSGHAVAGKIPERDTDTSRKPSKHILVVDDSLTVREVERRLLENAGYSVSVAVDGIDGWNNLQHGRFDLLVSDIDMPRMNGIALVKRLRSLPRFRDLPIMIVSYKDREEDRLAGMEAGADYYFTKGSFHDQSLLDAVKEMIG